MPRRAFKRLEDQPDDIDTGVDQIEMTEPNSHRHHHSHAEASPISERPSSSSSRAAFEGQPRRSMHQVDMDLEWPMIDIPQELREMQVDQDDSHTRSNSQANAIRVCIVGCRGAQRGTLEIEKKSKNMAGASACTGTVTR